MVGFPMQSVLQALYDVVLGFALCYDPSDLTWNICIKLIVLCWWWALSCKIKIRFVSVFAAIGRYLLEWVASVVPVLVRGF